VGECDTSETISAGVVDARVLRELVTAPQDNPDAARLEEDRLLDLLSSPAKLLVELPCAPDVGDAQGHQAQPLLDEFS
jgi:hypothetical protein